MAQFEHESFKKVIMVNCLLFASLLAMAQDPAPSSTDPQAQKKDSEPRLKSKSEMVSTGTSNFLDRASATVSVLSGDDLRTLGVQTFTDALRLMPGLEVEKLSASESGISVRGYVGPASASQGMMVVLDGRQGYNEFFGAPFWETLPVTMDEIKSIEVIRGPGSFLYGPNAMHGFVSITTMSPLDYSVGEYSNHQVFMSMSAGTYASNQESLTYIKREGDTGLKVNIAHDDMDGFDPRSDTKNKLIGTVWFETKPTDQQEVDLSAGATKQKFNVLFPETSSLAPAIYVTRANEYYLQGKYVLDNSITLRMSWTRFMGDGQPDAVYVPFSLVIDTGDVDLQFTFALGESNHFTVGTGLRYSTFVTSNEDIADGRHATRDEWVFVQDEVKLLDELFLTGGTRLDDHSQAGVTIAPRLALVYEFSPPRLVGDTYDPGQSLRATAGYGYRNPSLRELWFNMPVQTKLGPATVVGTTEFHSDLNPEMMRSFEVGYWGRPTSRLQAECSVYYNLLDHLVTYEAPDLGMTSPFHVVRENQDKEDAYGVEAALEYQLLAEMSCFGNYTYTVRRDRETKKRIPDAPQNMANAGVRYVNEHSVSGMLWVNFVDEITITDNFTRLPVGHVPAYALLNGKIWYPFKIGSSDGKVFIQGFNVTNHIHREHPDGQEYGAIAMAGVEIAW